MSWMRGKNKETGLHEFQCYDYNGKLFASGFGFADYRECEREAEIAERRMTIEMHYGPAPTEYAEMTLDEIFAELEL